MPEQAILAYFKSYEDASRAAEELRAMAVHDVQIAPVSSFPGGGPEPLRRPPIHGHIPSLASLTLSGELTDRDESPLAAAHPGASGMADEGDPDETAFNWLVTAVVPSSDQPSVLSLLRDLGALV